VRKTRPLPQRYSGLCAKKSLVTAYTGGWVVRVAELSIPKPMSSPPTTKTCRPQALITCEGLSARAGQEAGG
jgi:hypothetical protein